MLVGTSIRFQCKVTDLIAAVENNCGLANLVVATDEDIDNVVNLLLGITKAARADVGPGEPSREHVYIDIIAKGGKLDGKNVIVNLKMSESGASGFTSPNKSVEAFNNKIRELQKLISSAKKE